ncbi:MAG: ABC transporter substrate-binding protein [Bacillota bacterium]|nr:ABC transporter substrate-binding protein [Bacillota bacterium]
MFRQQKKFFLACILVSSLVLLAGCSKGKTETATGAVELRYATGFKIEHLAGGCKQVTDGEGRKLLLVPRGQRPPSGYGSLPVVYTPVERVVVGSTTQAALLRPLGELGSITGVTTEKEHWYLEAVKEGLEQGRIQLVGSGMGPLDYDRVVALRPDLVLIYTGTPGSPETLRKLEELKVPVAVENSHLEQHPLGRMEWVKFLAAFYGKEEAAAEFFEAAAKRTEEITGEAVKARAKPKVLWGSIYQGKVYVPAGASYAARMIEMAGGDYLFKDLAGAGSSTVTLEEFYARGKSADVYISSTMPNYGITSIAKIVEQAKVLADLPPVKEGKVWCFQPWYYQAQDKTDEMIADLAAIFHPELFPEVKIKHHLQLPTSS